MRISRRWSDGTRAHCRANAYAAAALDAGLDVVCDKPVTHDFGEACDLVARTRAHGRIFAIAHGYAAYPMTRYARQLVRDGALGTLRLVQVEYIQSGLAMRIEDRPQNNRLRWLLDPARSGQAPVMSAIGCHVQHLASFVLGLSAARVTADVGARAGRNGSRPVLSSDRGGRAHDGVHRGLRGLAGRGNVGRRGEGTRAMNPLPKPGCPRANRTAA